MTTVADDIWAILREVAQSQKEFQKEFKDSQKEFKAVQKEIHDMQKQNEREIKAVNVSIGRLTNRLGEFVQESVRPAAVRLFRERGIDVHEVHQNITAKRDGEGLEIDLLVINDKDVVVIECKSNLSIDDVNEHLIRLEKIRRLMPRYKDNRISGAGGCSQTECALALVFVFSSGSNCVFSQSGMNPWQKSSASQNICVTFMSGNLFNLINIFITAYILSCF